MYARLHVCMYGGTDVRMHAFMHACMHGWMDGWMDGWIDGFMDAREYVCVCHGTFALHSLRHMYEIPPYISLANQAGRAGVHHARD